MTRSSGGSGGTGRSGKWNWNKTNSTNKSVQIGNREVDTVSWMMSNVNKHSLLTHDESTELFKIYEPGSEVRDVGEQERRVATTPEAKIAHDQIVQANLKLVISVAKGYRRSGLDFEDLLQEGNLGLLRAVEKFKWEKGYRFSTYATWWIRQAVSQFVMKRSRTVRMPAHAIGISRKIDSVKSDFKKKFGEEPTDEELSSVLEVSKSIIKATVNGNKRTISLSTPVDRDSDDGDSLGDTIMDPNTSNNPHEAYSEKESFLVLKKSFAKLSARDEQILRLRFGFTDGDGIQFEITENEAEEIASREKIA